METKIIRFIDRKASPAVLDVGNKGDHEIVEVQFVLPLFLMGETVRLHLRIGKHSDVVRLPENRRWVLTIDHTQFAGNWTAWLESDLKNGAHWSCDAFILVVGDCPSDGGEPLEKQYPTAIEEALKKADALVNADVKAVTLSADSEASADVQTDENGNISIVYGIPKGKEGQKGTDGVPMLEVGDDGCLYLLDATSAIYTLTENGYLEVEVNG